MGKFWTIRNAADNPKVGEILLYGYISDVSWFGDEVTPRQFQKDLAALGDVDEIRVYINSGGGDAFAAQTIYNMLKRHKATVNTYVDGLAASAASIIAMVGETVTMPANSMLMIHNPWTMVAGYAEDLRKAAEMLDKVRDFLADIYQAKSGLERDEVIAIMDAETWLTADESVAKGFADVLEDARQVAASIDGDELTINGRKVDLARFRNFPKDKVAQTASVEQEPAEVEPEPVAEAEKPEPQAEAPAPDKSQERLRLLRLRARL